MILGAFNARYNQVYVRATRERANRSLSDRRRFMCSYNIIILAVWSISAYRHRILYESQSKSLKLEKVS